MSEHYNKKRMKGRRRRLRDNQTEAEEQLWHLLRNRQCLGIKFRRQYSVDYYVIDFYAPVLQLAVESDGGIHNAPDQRAYDQNRTDYLEAFGITIVRLPNQLVLREPEKALEKIKTAIRQLQEHRE